MAADALEPRMSCLEGAFQQMDKRLGWIEGRMDSLERTVQAFRLEIHADFRDLRSELREQFRWMLGLLAVAILSPAIVRLLLR